MAKNKEGLCSKEFASRKGLNGLSGEGFDRKASIGSEPLANTTFDCGLLEP